MQVIEGKNNSAVVYAETIDESCIEQIKQLLDMECFAGSKIRIMPDCHAGKGCVIGFTADFKDKVIPNVVGVDIGCGMHTVKLGKVDIDFDRFDSIVREFIPFGRKVHEGRITKYPRVTELKCYRGLRDTKRLIRSLGTLGGGNHFIELDRDEEGCVYLVIHSGSRNLGLQVAGYYQDIAHKLQLGWDEFWQEERRVIDEYKALGKRNEIEAVIKQMRREFKTKTSLIPKDLCYLTGEYVQDYLDDMRICQEFADLNRKLMAKILIEKYGFEPEDEFTTVHNYIDVDCKIIRKGAVSAAKGEKILVPINMRDGSLICIGKGNEDWNCSAPHGSGRILSRSQAKEQLKFEDFKKMMDEAGIYSTSVKEETIDESPMVYKGIEEIMETIKPTCDVIKIIKPIYNFKADN